MQLNSDKRTCIDIDECTTTSAGGLPLHDCSVNQTCKNIVITETSDLPKGFECECKPGYEWNPIEQKCFDVDECETTCSEPGSICANTPGSYSCSCQSGYSWNGSNCIDINECEHQNICGQKGKCENTIGSYYCECNAGYYFNSITCVDIDECTDESFSFCSASSKACVNVEGGYNCVPTTVSVQTLPAIVANCQTISCGQNSDCIATMTNAYCACKAGYYGNPKQTCSSDIGGKQHVIPQMLTLQVTYFPELKEKTSERFMKYKLAFESILDGAFAEKDGYILGSAQVLKFK